MERHAVGVVDAAKNEMLCLATLLLTCAHTIVHLRAAAAVLMALCVGFDQVTRPDTTCVCSLHAVKQPEEA